MRLGYLAVRSARFGSCPVTRLTRPGRVRRGCGSRRLSDTLRFTIRSRSHLTLSCRAWLSSRARSPSGGREPAAALRGGSDPARRRSAEAAVTVRLEQDLRYGTAGGQRLLLDAYLPTKKGALRPGVVFVHG